MIKFQEKKQAREDIQMRYVTIDIERLKGALSKRQAGVAESIGISLNSLSRKLNGRIGLTLDDLNKICRTIHRDPEEFIRYDDLEGLAA
jgi:DNA-binding Xre family transcriptional regulator